MHDDTQIHERDEAEKRTKENERGESSKAYTKMMTEGS